MTRTFSLCAWAVVFFVVWLSSCNDSAKSSVEESHNVLLDLEQKYNEIKFDYQYNLLNQYDLENSTIIENVSIYNDKGQKTTLETELKGIRSTVLFVRIYGDCFTCIAEIINEQINVINTSVPLLNQFGKVILIANLNSPRELLSVIDLNDQGDNFHAYFIPNGESMIEKEKARRGIYYSTFNVQNTIKLNHIYFPILGETEFPKKYFQSILNKRST